MFSIVFPNTELLISLKKSFLNDFFALVLVCLLKSIYPFNHEDFLNSNTPCTFFKVLVLNRGITVNFDSEERIYFYHSRLESVYSLDRFIFHICSGFFGNILTTCFQLLQLVQVQEGNHYGGHGGGYSKSPSKTNSFLLSSLSDLAKSVLLISFFW